VVAKRETVLSVPSAIGSTLFLAIFHEESSKNNEWLTIKKEEGKEQKNPQQPGIILNKIYSKNNLKRISKKYWQGSEKEKEVH